MTEPAVQPAPAPIEVDEDLVRDVGALVEGDQRGMVLNLIADLRPADVARIVAHLPRGDARRLFEWIPQEISADVLPELESAIRGDLLDDLSAPEIVDLLDRLETDDQADVLGDLAETDAETVQEVLPQLEDALDVRQLLTYDEETAGGLMSTDYVAVREAATVAEATEEVRRCAETIDPVYVVYAVDGSGVLTGVVPLKRLLLSPAHARIEEMANADFVTVEPDEDQEEVARIMERYDLVALPVVTSKGRLLGRITIDDVVDVIRDEAEEDLQRAVGITGEEEFSSSILAVSRGRLVWLLLGLVGAYVSGLVIV
ncbi:MAG: CBS domain-containing protein, partial [Bacteroidota bacterium]